MPLTIEDVRGLGSPQLAYKWRVTLPTIGDTYFSDTRDFISSSPRARARNRVSGVVNNAATTTGISSNSFNSRINGFNPSNFVEEIQGLPFPNVERESFYEGGRNTYFPGLEDLTPFTIVFFQNESSSVQDYIFQWKRKVVNPDGTKNYPREYKKPIRVELLSGRNEVVFEYRLIGCYPTVSEPYSLINTSERLRFTQEFSVDRVELLNENRAVALAPLENRLR